jgi:trans-2,3-dihydro-3-hydroxyanthranilate isomerase
MAREFYITNVFHHGPFTGNQLATITEPEGLTSNEMHKIALQFNFAETTFLMGGDANHGFDVRIFGPGGEMPFAGHPTLGSAFLIREHVEKLGTDLIELNLSVGKIPVTFADNGVLWMKQLQPEFGRSLPSQEVADGLSLSLSDIDEHYPAQLVSTGLEFLVVPVKSMDALKRCIVKPSLQYAYVFCRGGYSDDQSISARSIGIGGISEDAATGSAAGCLAGYLVEHGYFGSRQIEMQIGQGYEINRPSTLHLRASKEKEEYDINVGGRVRLVAKGELFV